MMSCWMRKTFSQLSELETLDHLQCLFVPLDSVSVIHLSARRVFIDTQAFFLNKENTFKTSLGCKLVCAVVVLLKLTNVLHLFLVFVLPTSPSKTLFSCQSNGPSRQRPSLASASEHCVSMATSIIRGALHDHPFHFSKSRSGYFVEDGALTVGLLPCPSPG